MVGKISHFWKFWLKLEMEIKPDKCMWQKLMGGFQSVTSGGSALPGEGFSRSSSFQGWAVAPPRAGPRTGLFLLHLPPSPLTQRAEGIGRQVSRCKAWPRPLAVGSKKPWELGGRWSMNGAVGRSPLSAGQRGITLVWDLSGPSVSTWLLLHLLCPYVP